MSGLTDDAKKLIDQHLWMRFIQVVSLLGVVNVAALIGIAWVATTTAQSAAETSAKAVATTIATDTVNSAIKNNDALKQVTETASKKALEVFEEAATLKGKVTLMANMVDEVQSGKFPELQAKVDSMDKRMKSIGTLLASTEKDGRVELLKRAQDVLDSGGKDIVENAERLSLRLEGIEDEIRSLSENEVLKTLMTQVTVYEWDASIDNKKVPVTAMFDFPAIHIRDSLTSNAEIRAIEFVKSDRPVTFMKSVAYPEFKKPDSAKARLNPERSAPAKIYKSFKGASNDGEGASNIAK